MADECLIDTPGRLLSLCEGLRDSTWLALDTEFVRERTYRPRLCLIQVATPQVIACVDAITLDTLEPLIDIIYDPHRVKVLHAARQDLEILFYMRGELPRPVFDTQLAAGLLGFGDQVGYSTLVRKLLGVDLGKAHTRTDWAERPLSRGQLRYAADDVRYLCDAYTPLVERLQEKGREGWLAQDFARLCDPRQYQARPEDAWQRVRGHQKLNRRQLCVLRALAAWREREAMQRDRPRQWVLADKLLLELARRSPKAPQQLERMRGVPGWLSGSRGPELVRLINEAQALPQEACPVVRTPPPHDPERDAVVDLMMALLHHLAHRHEVNAAAVATRHTLERLANGETDVPVTQGWRAEVAGNALKRLLEGTMGLRVEHRRLRIDDDQA
jgi:ribonuclease D